MAADILKGVVAVVIARLLTDDPWPAVAAAAAMAGHVFPVWLRFKGGKGVAVAGGAVIAPDAARGDHPASPIWVVVVATHPLHVAGRDRRRRRPPTPLAWALGYPDSTIVFAALAAAAVLFLHRGNTRRLLRGEENRIALGRARARRRGHILPRTRLRAPPPAPSRRRFGAVLGGF